MDRASGDEDKRPRGPSDRPFSYLDIDLTLQDLERLFLGLMDVLWRPATCYNLLEQRVSASSIIFRRLVRNRMPRYIDCLAFAWPKCDARITK